MGKGRRICDQCKWKGSLTLPDEHCVDHIPKLQVAPPGHCFPTTAQGAGSGWQTFTITNIGQGGNLSIGEINLRGNDSGQFEIRRDKASGQILKPNRSKTIQVRCKPTSKGLKKAEMVIPSNDPDGPASVQIRGTTYRVIVVISIDWDGHDLRDENSKEFEAFRTDRTRSPHQDKGGLIPLTHFMCASYFTGPTITAKQKAAQDPVNPSNVSDISAKMRRALRAGDEIAVHAHGWKTVVEGAGVTFSGTHHWNDPKDPDRATPEYHNCWKDVGHTNPLTDYSSAQVRDILSYSRTILDNNLGGGYSASNSFRSGGWVTSADVRQGMYDAGFRVDSSAVPSAKLPARAFSLCHGDWRGDMWTITEQHQPFTINLGGGGSLKEVPDNGYLADYVNADHIKDQMTRALTQQGPVLVSIGFHEESVDELYTYNNDRSQNGPYLAAHLQKIVAALNTWHTNGTWPSLEFLTVQDAADLFMP